MNTPSSIQRLRLARESFSRLFGDPLDLWVHCGREWTRDLGLANRETNAESLGSGLIAFESLPTSPETIEEPVVTELAPGILSICARLMPTAEMELSGNSTIIIAGTVRGTSQSLVASLLRHATEQNTLQREVGESRIGLTPHLEQISYDFEELTWLRKLNDQSTYYDITTSVGDMARRILPDLCMLVKAESLVFVGSVSRDEPSNASTAEVGRLLVCTGRQVLHDDHFARLVELVRRHEQPGRPLVLNHLASRDDFSQFPEILSCIYVPVLHRGSCFGWLLALNRIPWEQRAETPRELVPTAFCENEFGTGEASLVNTAAGALASHAHNASMYRQKEVLLIGVIRAMINAIDAKDAYTCGHSDRVAVIAKCIGMQMGLDSRECERLYTAGLLHDLGKIGIPDAILTKPGKLTEEEYAVIRRHPGIGHAILSHLPELGYVLSGVLHHHESVDGTGYPCGYRGEEIPLFGRILAVADSYDAMTSCRPYRTAMPVERAISILADGAGTQWDANVVRAFLESTAVIERSCAEADQNLPALLSAVPAARPAESQLHSDPILRAVSLTCG